MNVEDVTREIVRFLDGYLGIPSPGADTPLFEEAGLDSLQVNALVVFLEERYGVAIPGARLDLEQLATPRRVAELVVSLAG